MSEGQFSLPASDQLKDAIQSVLLAAKNHEHQGVEPLFVSEYADLDDVELLDQWNPVEDMEIGTKLSLDKGNSRLAANLGVYASITIEQFQPTITDRLSVEGADTLLSLTDYLDYDQQPFLGSLVVVARGARPETSSGFKSEVNLSINKGEVLNTSTLNYTHGFVASQQLQDMLRANARILGPDALEYAEKAIRLEPSDPDAEYYIIEPETKLAPEYQARIIRPSNARLSDDGIYATIQFLNEISEELSLTSSTDYRHRL